MVSEGFIEKSLKHQKIFLISFHLTIIILFLAELMKLITENIVVTIIILVVGLKHQGW